MSAARWRALAGVAVVLFVAGVTFSPAFGATLRTAAPPLLSGRLLLAVAVAVVLPMSTIALLRRRIPSGVVAGAGVVAVAVAVLLTFPGTAVARGPYQLLTAALPVAPVGPPLAAVTALVALGALISALVVTGSERPGWALLPPVVVLVLALALDAGPGEPGAEWSVVVVVTVLLGLAAVARAGDTIESVVRGRGRRAVVAVLGLAVVVGVVAGVAIALVPLVPGSGRPDRPADLRNLVDAPLLPSQTVSPLQQFLALRQGSPLVQFTGRSSQPGVDLPFVTLDHFDGRVWTSDAGYRRAGTTLPIARNSAPVGPDVDVALTTEAGSLGWLPRVGVANSLDLPGDTTTGLDERTGDLVVPAGSAFPSSWQVGGRQDIEAPVGTDAPAIAALTTARGAPTASVVDGGEAVPDDVTAFVDGLRGRTDLRTLQALVQKLRGTGWVLDDSADAPGGHGLFQVVALLTAATPVGAASPTAAGDGGPPRLHRGTAEQYASTFAVLARVLGFDSRVVMGLRPQYRDDGTFTAGGANVWAWPQVRFEGVGWVTFDPTPVRTFSADGSDEAPPPDDAGTSAGSDPPSATSSAPDPSSSDDRAEAGSGGAAGGGTGLWWALVAAVVVVVAALAPGTARGVRRSRRRRASPPGRAIAGAWAEAVGDLGSTGLAPDLPTRPTSAEVVAAAPEPLQGALRTLGDGVDRAGYAPEPPTAAEVRPAWAAADDVRRGARALIPRWRRVVAWLDPRPLRSRRH